MRGKKLACRSILSLLLLFLLVYRLVPVVRNLETYREYCKWDWNLADLSLGMLPAMLAVFAAMLAAICIVQLGPFLVLAGSILANWVRPPLDRNMYILCIFACTVVFLGEGFFAFAGWMGGSSHSWEMPWVNLAAALLDLTGLLLISDHRKRG